MEELTWLWISFKSLTWWQMILWIVYTLYFIGRSYHFWDETKHKFWKGYKNVIFGYDEYFRVYHIVRIIFDIPPAIVGLLFPALRKLLAFKIYKLNKNDEKTNN